MSAQLPDRVVFQGREYDLVSSNPPKLFNPFEWGVSPDSPHGACLRGTIATFEVKEDSLYLKELRYWTRQLGEVSLIPGEKRYEGKEGDRHCFLYRGINVPIPWNGEVTLGRSFVWPLLLPRGFQSAWKYKEVVRLFFQDGNLRAFGDVSRHIARMRAQVLEAMAV